MNEMNQNDKPNNTYIVYVSIFLVQARRLSLTGTSTVCQTNPFSWAFSVISATVKALANKMHSRLKGFKRTRPVASSGAKYKAIDSK